MLKPVATTCLMHVTQNAIVELERRPTESGTTCHSCAANGFKYCSIRTQIICVRIYFGNMSREPKNLSHVMSHNHSPNVDALIRPRIWGDLFNFLDADKPVTTRITGSSKSEVEGYIAISLHLRKPATLSNTGEQTKMAKSSYPSFEISGQSGL